MDYLAAAISHNKKALDQILPIEGKLRAAAILRNEYAGFKSCLDLGEDRLSVVAQISRTSPLSSAPEADDDPTRLAERMYQGGAQGMSIITESLFFGGTLGLLAQLSKTSPVPILARDLWLHPAEICQAVISGADAINLIAAAMPPEQLEELYRMATGLGLDVMVEVHSIEETETALDLEAGLICINQRNPHTLELDPELAEKLIEEIPHDITVLTSGGINDAESARRALEAGSNGVIIGQAIMNADIPQDLISEILSLRLQAE